MIKLNGILCSHCANTLDHMPVWTQPSTAPYSDMIMTIGTTIQVEMVMTLRRGLLSGLSKNPKATPFASLDTKNQSQQKAKT